MTIVTSLCGADDWPQIVVLSNSMREWMSQFVDMLGGVPSEYTFKRVFFLLAPKEINHLLIAVSKAINTSSGKDIINFDGKTLRGTRNEQSGLKAIHPEFPKDLYLANPRYKSFGNSGYIGKLGGHLGRKKDPLPGVKAIWTGICKLTNYADAWDLFGPGSSK